MIANSAATMPVPAWWKISQTVVATFATAFCMCVLWVFAARIDGPHLRFWCADIGLIVGAPWVWLSAVGALRYHRWWPSVVLPVIVSSTVVLVSAGAPARLGWAISRAAMEKLAAGCDAQGVPARAGFYTIEEINYGLTACAFDLGPDRQFIRAYEDDPGLDVPFCESLGSKWYYCTEHPNLRQIIFD